MAKYHSTRPPGLGFSFEDKVRATLKLCPDWTENEKRAYWIGIDDSMFSCYGKVWLDYSFRVFGIIFPNREKR